MFKSLERTKFLLNAQKSFLLVTAAACPLGRLTTVRFPMQAVLPASGRPELHRRIILF